MAATVAMGAKRPSSAHPGAMSLGAAVSRGMGDTLVSMRVVVVRLFLGKSAARRTRLM